MCQTGDIWTRLEALDFLPKEVRRELYLVGMTDALEAKEPMPKNWRWRLELHAGTIKRDIARATRQYIDSLHLASRPKFDIEWMPVPEMGYKRPRLDLLETP